MNVGIKKAEFLETVFKQNIDKLDGNTLRYKRIRVPGKELSLAHIIGTSSRRIYENLGLHIGAHAGEDHTGESIGLMNFSPWETTIAAADVAMKSGNVQIGFLDRFNGSLIILGDLASVRTAVEAVRDFARDELEYAVCNITER